MYISSSPIFITHKNYYLLRVDSGVVYSKKIVIYIGII